MTGARTTGRKLQGVAGVCALCGKNVRPAYIDAQGRHTAMITYGTNRAPCGGQVIPTPEDTRR